MNNELTGAQGFLIAAAIASMAGQRASGFNNKADAVATRAWDDAQALWAAAPPDIVAKLQKGSGDE